MFMFLCTTHSLVSLLQFLTSPLSQDPEKETPSEAPPHAVVTTHTPTCVCGHPLSTFTAINYGWTVMLLIPSRLLDKAIPPSSDLSLLHSVSPSTRSLPPACVHVLPSLIINLPPLSYMPIHLLP